MQMRVKMSLNQTGQHRYFLCLDGMRGIAALLIVLRHTEPLFGEINFPSSYLAVDLFFLLSGAVIANAYESALINGLSLYEFLTIRITRLYPLYFLGLCLGVVSALITAQYSNLALANHILLSLLMLPNPDVTEALFPLNGPSWSILYEVAINIVYFLFLRAVTGKALLSVLVITAAAMTFWAFAGATHSLDAGYHIQDFYWGACRITFSFYMGIFLFRNSAQSASRTAPRSDNRVAWILIVAAVITLVSGTSVILRPAYDLLAVTCIFPVLIYLGLQLRPTGMTATLLRLGGIISFPVYVLHYPLSRIVESAYAFAFGASISDHAPLAGYAFAVGLVPLCLFLNKAYDVRLRKAIKSTFNPIVE
jgi:peptidoglycan/LPS O-acetylase OafA/YrhL